MLIEGPAIQIMLIIEFLEIMHYNYIKKI